MFSSSSASAGDADSKKVEPPALVRYKRASGRAKDLADLEALGESD